MEKLVMLSGIATRCYVGENADKPAILLIHGYMESLETWDTLTPLLERDFCVLSLDLPGHGVSQTPEGDFSMSDFARTALALLDKCGVEKAVVVGHSMGGYVASAFASEHTDRCAGLVLLNSSPLGDTPERAEARKREIKLIKEGKKELLAAMGPAKGFAPCNMKRMEEHIDALTEQAMITEDEGLLTALNAMMTRKDYAETLSKLPFPMMAVFGSDDSFISEEAKTRIIDATPTMKHLTIEKTGHQTHIENPEAVAEAIVAMFAEA